MSIANVLVSNNLPVKAGSQAFDSMVSKTTGYTVEGFPGTQVGANVLLDSLVNVEPADYLVEYVVCFNADATTPSEDLGVQGYVTVKVGGSDTVIDLTRALKKCNASGVAGASGKVCRFQISGAVTVRLTQPVTLELYGATTPQNDVDDTEIFSAPVSGITISQINAEGNFLTF